MTETFTAFEGTRRLASGALGQVALAVRDASAKAATTKAADARTPEPLLIFSDASGRAIDLDLRGSADDVIARLPASETPDAASSESSSGEPRGRGRPKLGVVAREVTLLPRHWQWLNAQPGGASVALRRLVEKARRAHGDTDRRRAARDAAYHFMSAMAGNRPNFEEASRAMFADDRPRLANYIAHWPADIRDHVVRLMEPS